MQVHRFGRAFALDRQRGGARGRSVTVRRGEALQAGPLEQPPDVQTARHTTILDAERRAGPDEQSADGRRRPTHDPGS